MFFLFLRWVGLSQTTFCLCRGLLHIPSRAIGKLCPLQFFSRKGLFDSYTLHHSDVPHLPTSLTHLLKEEPWPLSPTVSFSSIPLTSSASPSHGDDASTGFHHMLHQCPGGNPTDVLASPATTQLDQLTEQRSAK